MRVLERAHDLRPPLARPVEDLSPEPLLGDQVILEPRPDLPLPRPRRLGGLADGVVVEAGERIVDLAERDHVGELDRRVRRRRRQRAPELPAHDLQLHGLDVRPVLLDHAVAPLHPHLPEVVDESSCGFGAERSAVLLGRTPHRRLGSFDSEEVEAVAGTEPLRHQREVRIELRDEVLAHREQRPPTPVPQCDAELVEVRPLLVLVGRVEREQLLELVEDQAWLGAQAAAPSSSALSWSARSSWIARVR